jgi:hypothetical protein
LVLPAAHALAVATHAIAHAIIHADSI